MRCNDCGKFVSYDDPPTVEIQDEEPDFSDNAFEVSFTVKLLCADCNGDLKENEFNETVDVGHECDKGNDGSQYEWTESLSAEGQSSSDPGTVERVIKRGKRKGKVVQRFVPARYRRTYYGAEITGKVKCTVCKEEMDIDQYFKESASSFNEC